MQASLSQTASEMTETPIVGPDVVGKSNGGKAARGALKVKKERMVRPRPPARSHRNSVFGNIGGEISSINKSVSSLLSCTLKGSVTRFREPLRQRTLVSFRTLGHWTGKVWIFEFQKNPICF